VPLHSGQFPLHDECYSVKKGFSKWVIREYEEKMEMIPCQRTKSRGMEGDTLTAYRGGTRERKRTKGGGCSVVWWV